VAPSAQSRKVWLTQREFCTWQNLFIMAALWNMTGHYIFALWFLSFFFFFLFFLA